MPDQIAFHEIIMAAIFEILAWKCKLLEQDAGHIVLLRTSRVENENCSSRVNKNCKKDLMLILQKIF